MIPTDRRRYPNEELVRVVSRHGFADRSALDLGCGAGANAWMLAKEGFSVVAVDSDPEAVAEAYDNMNRFLRTDEMEWVNFIESDALSAASAREGFFSLVVDCWFSYCLETANFRDLLRHVHDALRSGGVFWSWHPSKSSDVWMSSRSDERIDRWTLNGIQRPGPYCGNKGPFRFLWPAEYKTMLVEAGFGDVTIERHGRTYGRDYFEMLSVTARV